MTIQPKTDRQDAKGRQEKHRRESDHVTPVDPVKTSWRSLALLASWRFAFVGLIGLIGLIGLGNVVSAEGVPRPNFVFIMTDDHAYQAVSAYGSVLNQTPHIDRIAEEGIRFDRCYVANSICAPSRATILTGKHSSANGVADNFTDFDGGQWTFPKALQAVGYQTAMVGKWHLKTDPTGFDFWDILPGQGKYYRPDFRTRDGRRPVEGYVTEVTTDLGINWLDGKAGPGGPGRDANKPFLLMLQQKAPHRPWDPAPERLREFEDHDFPEPETLFDDYTTRTEGPREAEMRIADHMRVDRDVKAWAEDSNHRQWLYKHMSDDARRAWERVIDPRHDEFRDAALTGHARTRWVWRHYLEDYLACVSSVDESVGRVLDWLEAEGLADNTVVVYTSDQGFYLGEHGWFDKRFIYEPSLRTPMVVRWPAGIAAPGRAEGKIVSNLDIAPTFCELAGAEPDPTMAGRSFVPLLKGEHPASWRETFYYHYHEGPKDHAVARHDGVTNGRHKLIHFYELGDWELYDLESDPRETSNLVDDPGYDAVEAELMTVLSEHRQAYGFVAPPQKVTQSSPRR